MISRLLDEPLVKKQDWILDKTNSNTVHLPIRFNQIVKTNGQCYREYGTKNY